MTLMLNDLFSLTTEEIKKSKIEFNMKDGNTHEKTIDRWLACSKTDKEDGTCAGCSYWGWYSKSARNLLPEEWSFSFVRLNDVEWLFVSAAKIIDVPKESHAIVEILERFKPYFGRLIIKCKKGDSYSRYIFKMHKYIDSCEVKEILPGIYSGEQFEGYNNVYLEHKKLEDIFAGKIMPTYKIALEKITGIYCLTNKDTGMLYIGSASGGGGLAARWGDYLKTKHGGNVKLRRLYKEKGKEYFEENFTFTLLEYFNLSYDHDKIIEREQYWKKCFNSIEKGYNDN